MKSIAVALVAVGMHMGFGCLASRSEWSTGLRNVGEHEILDSAVALSRFNYRVGVLAPNAPAVFSCDHAVLPEVATIRWLRKGGTWQERQVAVKRVLPERFQGCIYFSIDDSDNVTVVPKPE